MEEILNKNVIDFKFSEIECQKLLNKIKDGIKSNEKIIRRINEIDFKHYNKKIDLEKVNNIIEKYRNDKIKNNEKMKRYLVEYNGSIYITIQLCLLAILNKIQIILDINNFLVGLNTIFVDIINQELKKYKIDNLITICDSIDYDEIKKNEKSLDEILCIDDFDIYNDLLDENIKDAKLIKYNSIDLYCDDDDLVELRDMICDYADNNHLQIEVYDDELKEKAADIINKYGEGAIVLLLSGDENLQKDFTEKIVNKQLVINKIPFDETKKLIL